MGYELLLFLLLACLPSTLAQNVAKTSVIVDASRSIAETNANFICATIDWWPGDKCNYNRCPWGNASVVNMDLSHPSLAKAVQAFTSLRIRIGGSLQDQVLYNVPSLKFPCHPFFKKRDGLFGFSKGCLSLDRWDALNRFFHKTGAIITFGLNALHGRQRSRSGVWEGRWDSTNARDFIEHTISKGYHIDSWEFGNELSGRGIGASVDAEQYGKDLTHLKGIINQLYRKSPSKPAILAPGGFFDEHWFTKLLQVTGPGTIDALTHHIYNLGAGNDPKLVKKILDPNYLGKISNTFSTLRETIQQWGPWASAWVGEAGGAYNSGGRLISNTFVNSFWYLDQLGMASLYHTKVYCRQSLIGGHYGLLNTSTFVPNPDYYSALLWHKLMGKRVLASESDASSFLRVYAHCTKGRAGITLLFINLSNETSFIPRVQNRMNINIQTPNGNTDHQESSFSRGLKRSVSWVGNKASDGRLQREEYHLTPKDGYLRSQTMVLNGKPLLVSSQGDIPRLEPVLVSVNSPLYISPLSIAFIVFPNFDAPACKF